jgi:hypothetical protein
MGRRTGHDRSRSIEDDGLIREHVPGDVRSQAGKRDDGNSSSRSTPSVSVSTRRVTVTGASKVEPSGPSSWTVPRSSNAASSAGSSSGPRARAKICVETSTMAPSGTSTVRSPSALVTLCAGEGAGSTGSGWTRTLYRHGAFATVVLSAGRIPTGSGCPRIADSAIT